MTPKKPIHQLADRRPSRIQARTARTLDAGSIGECPDYMPEIGKEQRGKSLDVFDQLPCRSVNLSFHR